MIIEVKLPFSSVFVCDICGNCGTSREAVEYHCSGPITEQPKVEVGDELWLERELWEQDPFHGRVYKGRSEPEKWKVLHLFYAGPGSFTQDYEGRLLWTHRLYMILTQFYMPEEEVDEVGRRIIGAERNMMVAHGELPALRAMKGEIKAA